MILSYQIRAARALLELSQAEVAALAGISIPTVKRAEARDGIRVSEDAIRALQGALEAAGVIFIPGNGDGPGVRLKAQAAET